VRAYRGGFLEGSPISNRGAMFADRLEYRVAYGDIAFVSAGVTRGSRMGIVDRGLNS